MSGLQIVVTWLFFLFNDGNLPNNNSLTLSYGSLQTDKGDYSSPFSSQNKVYDATLQFKPHENLRGIRYGTSAFYTESGTVMIGGGVSKTITFNKLEFTTLFHPSLTYIGGIDNKRASFPINLRSSIEASYSITKHISIGGGFTHISNGTVTHPNNGLDIAKITIGYNF